MNSVFCTHCGKPILADAKFCVHCGQAQSSPQTTVPEPAPAPKVERPGSPATNPQSQGAALPPGVKGWSWGAFWLSWIWAIFNKTWIGLLALVPVANLVMPFVLGFKGREWAWKNRHWDSVEQFQRTQARWSLAGWIVAVSVATLVFAALWWQDHHQAHPDATSQSIAEAVDQGAKGYATQAEAAKTAADSLATLHYDRPVLRFQKDALLAGIQHEVGEPHTGFIDLFLSDPQAYARHCMEGTSEFAQAQNMSLAEAQGIFLNSCRQEIDEYLRCLNTDDTARAVECMANQITSRD